MGAAIGDVLGLAAGGEQAVTLAVFVVIGSMGVLAPLIVYLVGGEHAARTLDTWKTLGRRPQRRRHGRAVRGIWIQACR